LPDGRLRASKYHEYGKIKYSILYTNLLDKLYKAHQNSTVKHNFFNSQLDKCVFKSRRNSAVMSVLSVHL